MGYRTQRVCPRVDCEVMVVQVERAGISDAHEPSSATVIEEGKKKRMNSMASDDGLKGEIKIAPNF